VEHNKTPAQGTAFRRPLNGGEVANRPPISGHMPGPEKVLVAKDIAAKAAAILPDTFERVLPRGYTINGNALVMARFEMIGTRGQALYGRHNHWGEKEATVFLRDLKDGWLAELGAYMRWQLRQDPIANAEFQHALVHLHDEASRRIKIL
jgi:hypothetical protein